MKDIKIIRNILILMAVVIIFYLLKLLSFIFVPLVCAIFLALFFMPLMRWMYNRKVPMLISLVAVVLIILGGLTILGWISNISTLEVFSAENGFAVKAETKINKAIQSMGGFFGWEENVDLDSLLHGKAFSEWVYGQFGSTFNFLRRTLTTLLLTLFFLMLLLAGSLNFQQLMEHAIFRQKTPSIKTFIHVERSIITFLKVKFWISLATGVGFGVVAWAFGISFPLFWGLFAFAINFVQMVGSIIAVITLSIFSLAEIDATGTWWLFALCLTGVQLVFGSVLEPIMMGKSFRINTITVLVMLMLWGFIWSVPGLILAIPITVLVKTILEHIPKTQQIAKLMS